MRKGIISLMAVGLLSVGSLAACGNDSNNSGKRQQQQRRRPRSA